MGENIKRSEDELQGKVKNNKSSGGSLEDQNEKKQNEYVYRKDLLNFLMV